MTRRIIGVYSLVMLMLVIATLGTASAAMGNPTYIEAVGSQSAYTLHVASSRGTIYDRNLQPLTNAGETYISAVVPSLETVSRLSLIVDENDREQVFSYLEAGKPFIFEVNSPVSTDGISTFTVSKRYSAKQPASNIIGYLQGGRSGVSGIEKSYDSVLSSGNGSITATFTVDAVGRAIRGESINVTNTYEKMSRGIMLTLDRDIQVELEKACVEIDKGAAVILECGTGEILAMASFPSLDPNNLAAAMNDPDSPYLNRALCAYSPGSVFKLVTAAAALEVGTDYRGIYECTGKIDVNGLDFECFDSVAHGDVNMHTALRKSCNCYFIDAASKIGASPILKMSERMKLGQEIELADGLVAASGILPDSNSLSNDRALANFSFGQGDITVTPLHVAAMVNAIANGGEYLSPQIFRGTVTDELEVSDLTIPESVKVMEPTTSNRLRAYMESTARFGTARKGAPTNCVSGIKTGTAQTGVSDDNGSEIQNYWYAGYICDENEKPAYTIVIMEETAKTAFVPEAFKKIAEKLIDFV